MQLRIAKTNPKPLVRLHPEIQSGIGLKFKGLKPIPSYPVVRCMLIIHQNYCHVKRYRNIGFSN